MTFTRKNGPLTIQQPAPGAKLVDKNHPQAKDQLQRLDLDELFQQHWERLCGVLFQIVGDGAEAEDLALEAFLRLYRRPPRDDRNLGGWLYRVATHLGLNALRSRRRRQQYEEEAGSLDYQNDSAWDPATVLEKAQERERVRLALAYMKPRSAQLLVLRHSGLAYAEVASALGIAPGSVGTLLARAEREFEQRYQQLTRPEG